MANQEFIDEWDDLPEAYKSKFLEILTERGLMNDFETLPREQKSQILEIIKEHVFGESPAAPDSPPKGDDPPEK